MKIEEIKKIVETAYKDLQFESEKHIYNVRGIVLPSVSGIKKQYENEFDADKIAGFVAKSRGISKKEVLTEWDKTRDEACDNGTLVHEFAEDYGKGWKKEPPNLQAVAAKKFWDELPNYYVPVFFELQMFHKDKGYAGTADLILYDKRTKSLVICDYKTNKDLFKNYKEQTLKTPFKDLLDTPFNKYQIQLSMYQMMLNNIGIPVSGRFIIHLKKTGTYEIMQTNDYSTKIEKSLKIS